MKTSRGNYDDRLVREQIKIGGLLLNPYNQTHESKAGKELVDSQRMCHQEFEPRILKYPTKKINQHTFGFVQANAF